MLFEGGGGAYAQKDMGVHEGDIVDVKTVYGRYAEQRSLFSSYTFGSSDFNKHVVRVSRVVCKQDDEACLSIPDNRIEGILCRHQETEYSPAGYLIPEDVVKLAIEKDKLENATNPWGASY